MILKKSKFYVFSCIFFLAFVVLSGCSLTDKDESSEEEYVIDESDFIQGDELVEDISEASGLTADETAGLILMREEEKLARDVYRKLGDKWGLNIFDNIADSEQTHTDAVKVLLDRYDIDDPVKDDSIGVFTSSDLAGLYNDLVEKGSASLVEALVVGATVEDLDIKDLTDLLAKTDSADIITTYNNLTKGSRNHLRAFVSQIEKNGGSYSPQYISQAEYDDIVSSEQEKGQVK